MLLIECFQKWAEFTLPLPKYQEYLSELKKTHTIPNIFEYYDYPDNVIFLSNLLDSVQQDFSLFNNIRF